MSAVRALRPQHVSLIKFPMRKGSILMTTKQGGNQQAQREHYPVPNLPDKYKRKGLPKAAFQLIELGGAGD